MHDVFLFFRAGLFRLVFFSCPINSPRLALKDKHFLLFDKGMTFWGLEVGTVANQVVVVTVLDGSVFNEMALQYVHSKRGHDQLVLLFLQYFSFLMFLLSKNLSKILTWAPFLGSSGCQFLRYRLASFTDVEGIWSRIVDF